MRAVVIGALALCLLPLVGCGSDAAQTASDSKTPPRVGACRDLSARDLTRASNDGKPVACAKEHTAQTFLVGELPRSTGTAYDDKGHAGYVYAACTKAFGSYLGADESMVMRSRLSWAWFRPSERGWDKGARWFRCDVVGGPQDATSLRPLPEEAEGMFGTDLPDAWFTCADGESVSTGTKVACTEPHTWRAVTTVKIGQPDDAYPGDRLAEVRSRDYCKDSVRGWLGYPPDFEFGYSWFREDHWDGGNRRAVCWARTTK
ncbi:hypothetical protein ABIE44_000300 [Marmoricola sp. OAE513]|uniref:septum formation family protein n=1 Tax=Marmoricola sp. OAE513 TaxID=2817894 RepID=UPI001AE79C04